VKKKRSRTAADKKKPWILYILKCGDGSLYAGITNDLPRRLTQHRYGRASRYTRSRRPVKIVYDESCASRSEALKKEYAVKALSREEKKTLIGRKMKKSGTAGSS
jgi:putative endonuclease